MEYRKDKRTKNLTLRDIHVGDWVQVWSEHTERYSPPLKITQICDDGTIYLVTSDEERPTPWEEDIKNVDALPITEELLMGFGFDVSDKYDDRGFLYQNISHNGKYVGQIRYPRNYKAYVWLFDYDCEYLHEYISYNYRNNIDIKLEWKGIER